MVRQFTLAIALAAGLSFAPNVAFGGERDAPIGIPCAGELGAYGFDVGGFAARMDALAAFVSGLRTSTAALTEVRNYLKAEHMLLKADIPSLHVVLGDHRRGEPTLAVANAVRAHNLKNQLALVDTMLTNFEIFAADCPDAETFLRSRGGMLVSLARTASFLARTARRSGDSVELMPLVVSLVNEDIETLLRGLFTPTEVTGIFAASGMSVVGVEIDGDEPLLVEAFTNLMVNAAAAMKARGGKHFTVRVSQRQVHAHAPAPIGLFRPVAPSRDGEHIVWSFIDSGGGMPADRVAALWSGQSTKGLEGNGIGLPHVAFVVRGHHGFIEVKGRPGTGTVVNIGIPKRAPSAPRKVVVSTPDREEAPDIIIVDDLEDTADSLADLLTMLKVWKAAPAYRGVDALKAVRPGKPQLVILDLTIPGERVEETVKAFRLANPEVLIALHSGIDADRRPELEKMVDAWWRKPVDLSVVLDFAKAKLSRP